MQILEVSEGRVKELSGGGVDQAQTGVGPAQASATRSDGLLQARKPDFGLLTLATQVAPL